VKFLDIVNKFLDILFTFTDSGCSDLCLRMGKKMLLWLIMSNNVLVAKVIIDMQMSVS
jgi:hypothetical protein